MLFIAGGSSTLPRQTTNPGRTDPPPTQPPNNQQINQQNSNQQQQQQHQHAHAIQKSSIYDSIGAGGVRRDNNNSLGGFGRTGSRSTLHASQMSLQQQQQHQQQQQKMPQQNAGSMPRHVNSNNPGAADADQNRNVGDLNRSLRGSRRDVASSKSVDYSEMGGGGVDNSAAVGGDGGTLRRQNRSRSQDDVNDKGEWSRSSTLQRQFSRSSSSPTKVFPDGILKKSAKRRRSSINFRLIDTHEDPFDDDECDIQHHNMNDKTDYFNESNDIIYDKDNDDYDEERFIVKNSRRSRSNSTVYVSDAPISPSTDKIISVLSMCQFYPRTSIYV